TLSTGQTFTWDGRNDAGQIVSPGQYYFEVKSTDGQGGQSEFTQSVVVLHGGGDLEKTPVVVYPNPTNPSTYGNLVTFKDPSGSLNLSVKLYTLAGERVPLPALTAVGGGLYTLDISKLASGLYIADIELSDASGGRQRQITQLAVLR
ncbi:MAG TPA: FlgD immunoglobulin-like domain containing protein, partial [bacterium]|nr:FlgD immunoglobulin-like domain containing protein [bacterium]